MKTGMVTLGLVAAMATSVGAQEIAVGSRVGTRTTSGYDGGNRRDPFVSLIAPKKTATPLAGRPVVGLSGLSITDAVVTGLVKVGPTVLAILQAPDGKSFTAHAKDKLADGVVKSIDTGGIVFIEQSADAAGMVHPHEVRKTIHTAAGGGQ